jgi:hypothetical protein
MSDSSSNAPPDWSMVHFDVECPRCGERLNGHHESTCPKCELDLDWTEIAPVQQLACPNCEYLLYGLSKPRCPECGNEFSWKRVLEDWHAPGRKLFELSWKQAPVRSFFTSVFASLRPKRLWTTERMSPRSTIISSLTLVVVANLSLLALAAVVKSGMIWPQLQASQLAQYQGAKGLGFLLYGLTMYYGFFFLSSIPWQVGTLGTLLILKESMRRSRVRIRHVFRLWSYAIVGTITVIAILEFGTTVIFLMTNDINFYSLFYSPRPSYIHWPSTIVAIGPLTFFATWQFYCAYRHYLKMPHAMWIAFLAQVVGVLLTIVVSHIGNWLTVY